MSALTEPRRHDSDNDLLRKICLALGANGDGVVGPQGPAGPAGASGVPQAQTLTVLHADNSPGTRLQYASGLFTIYDEDAGAITVSFDGSSEQWDFKKQVKFSSTVLFSGTLSGLIAGATNLGSVAIPFGSVYGTFIGALTGNVTGNVTGALTGNASTATSAATLTTARNINGVSFNGSGDITLPSLFTHSVLTYAATTNIDFATTSDFRTETLTGNLTFTTSNLTAAKTVTIRIVGDGSIRTLAFPAGWKFVGAAAPASLTASKVGILTITSFATTDADCIAAYAAEP